MNQTAFRLIQKLYPIVVFSIVSCIVFSIYFANKTESAIQNIGIQRFENYDIRTDQTAKNRVENYIVETGLNASDIASSQKSLQRSIENLRLRIPNLKVEFNEDLKIPEVITNENNGKFDLLTDSNNQKRDEILRNFLKQNSELFGLNENQINHLKTTADYTNPNGVLSFVHLEQTINEIPVFRGEVKAGFTKKGEIIRIINNLAPSLDSENLNDDFGTPEFALQNAAKTLNIRLNQNDLQIIEKESDELKTVFKRGQFEDKTTAEKIYFPITNGVARTAWRVLIWTKSEAFYVIVDAQDGTLLWRKSITEFQTQPSTFNVYGNLTSPLKTADSPSPLSPACVAPNNCPQPPITNRMDFTLIGNEPPYNFNNLGWIPDGENRTIGNNAEAGIDRISPNGIDPDGWAFGNSNRVFSYTYNPAPGNPPPGEEPLPTTQTYPPSQFQQGTITHAFYTVNRWHDETYLLGFTEQAGNFQNDNFGRGGLGNDHLSVEVQESNFTNGANFFAPADGSRGRLQLAVWANPTPDRDGGLDSQVAIHEITHGLSNRLHGNATGLGSNMARGMGEGWSDFYSIAMLSEPSDDLCGNYTVGSYSLYEIFVGYASYYYGVRRFPTARIQCLGPNGNPHNPLTFANLNAGNCTNFPSAFPSGTLGSTTCDQTHNAGEIWNAALWEVRGFLIEQHGASEGNRRALQYATDGMKLSPLNPTMLQARDSVIAAANASAPNDVQAVRRGFAVRGMGYSSQIISVSPAQVIEAFDFLPTVSLKDPLTFSEPGGDGHANPGDTITFHVSLENNSGETVPNVRANINGSQDVNYGNIPNGSIFTRDIVYTIPTSADCSVPFQININILSDNGNKTENRSIRLGTPNGSPITFSNNTQIVIPTSGVANPYPSTINVSGISGNRKFKVSLESVAHEFPNDIDILLESPAGQKYIFLSDSGGTSEVSNINLTLKDDAETQPSTTQWVSGEFKPYNSGANDSFASPAPASPYSNAAPAGSDTFESVFGSNTSNMNGDWKLWVIDDANPDSGTIGSWSITFEPEYFCVVCVNLCPGNRAIADFDGDGRSDIAVYRPSEGNWYLNQSTNGFGVLNWGLSTDQLTPSDFDGDGKTDTAIFRPNDDPAQADFYLLNSSNFTFSGFSWGLLDDIPVIEDYDGDGKADISIFRPSQNLFYVVQSVSGNVLISRPMPSGIPTHGDFDGDGKGDFATYNNGQWFISQSSTNHTSGETVFFGIATDKLVPADYDGDAKTDVAVYRPSDGVWYIQKSSGGFSFIQWGISTDIPSPGDYDGDGKTDVAVYREGVWYINQSTGGIKITQFGLAGDIPIAAEYFP